jgi:hypothetical protein
LAEARVWGDTTELARYEAITGTHTSFRQAMELRSRLLADALAGKRSDEKLVAMVLAS